jgi:hypothetical protein
MSTVIFIIGDTVYCGIKSLPVTGKGRIIKHKYISAELSRSV